MLRRPKLSKNEVVAPKEEEEEAQYSALPDDGDYIETCWSCFNVNFNTPFKTILLCFSW